VKLQRESQFLNTSPAFYPVDMTRRATPAMSAKNAQVIRLHTPRHVKAGRAIKRAVSRVVNKIRNLKK